MTVALRIPSSAPADVQQAFRDVRTAFETFPSGTVDFKGQRISNAGRAVQAFDYVTKRDLDLAIAKVGTSAPVAAPEPLIQYGTHATRTGIAPGALTDGALFVETDRVALYQVQQVSGAAVWALVGGSFDPKGDNDASKPSDLGTTDAGYVFFAKDKGFRYRWSGSAWKYHDGILIDVFANRPAFGSADTNFVFVASDRGNQAWAAGTSAWTLLAGWGEPMSGTLSPDQKPTLTTADAGLKFYATDFDRTYRWTGAVWADAIVPSSVPRKTIVWSDIALGTGFALCDGSTVTVSTSSGGTASYTTPNLTGSNAFVRANTTSRGTGGSLHHFHGLGETGTLDGSTLSFGGTTFKVPYYTPSTPETGNNTDGAALPPYMDLIPYVRL